MLYGKAVQNNELLDCKWRLPWMGGKRCIWRFITLQLQPQVCLFILLWRKSLHVYSSFIKGTFGCPWVWTPPFITYFDIQIHHLEWDRQKHRSHHYKGWDKAFLLLLNFLWWLWFLNCPLKMLDLFP